MSCPTLSPQRTRLFALRSHTSRDYSYVRTCTCVSAGVVRTYVRTVAVLGSGPGRERAEGRRDGAEPEEVQGNEQQLIISRCRRAPPPYLHRQAKSGFPASGTASPCCTAAAEGLSCSPSPVHVVRMHIRTHVRPCAHSTVHVKSALATLRGKRRGFGNTGLVRMHDGVGSYVSNQTSLPCEISSSP